jgi:hypothetical protein
MLLVLLDAHSTIRIWPDPTHVAAFPFISSSQIFWTRWVGLHEGFSEQVQPTDGRTCKENKFHSDSEPQIETVGQFLLEIETVLRTTDNFYWTDRRNKKHLAGRGGLLLGDSISGSTLGKPFKIIHNDYETKKNITMNHQNICCKQKKCVEHVVNWPHAYIEEIKKKFVISRYISLIKILPYTNTTS